MTLKEFQNKFHDLVHGLVGGALGFFDALSSSIEKNGGQILRDAALAAVQAAETTGGTGDVKFAAALAAVIATLEKEGIPVVLNAVRGAIEGAVAQVNGA